MASDGSADCMQSVLRYFMLAGTSIQLAFRTVQARAELICVAAKRESGMTSGIVKSRNEPP